MDGLETKSGVKGSQFPIWQEDARLLCYSAERPHWVNLTLQLDGRGCHSPRLEWVSSEGELIALVHEHQFEVIILSIPKVNHFDSQIKSLVELIRTSGNHDPILLLAEHIDPRELARCYAADLEFLHSSLSWDAPALVSAMERTRRRHLQQEEHRLWSRERQHRLLLEQKESGQILEQQRKMLQDLRSLACPESLTPRTQALTAGQSDLYEATSSTAGSDQHGILTDLKKYYAGLLRSYVVMGTGSLSDEIKQVVFQLEVSGLSIREVMALHLEQVEELVRGLGNRSSRHVMSRADMLILELMMHLAEGKKGS